MWLGKVLGAKQATAKDEGVAQPRRPSYVKAALAAPAPVAKRKDPVAEALDEKQLARLPKFFAAAFGSSAQGELVPSEAVCSRPRAGDAQERTLEAGPCAPQVAASPTAGSW